MSKSWRLAFTVLMITVTVFCLVMMVAVITIGGLPGIGLAVTLVSLTAIGAGFGYMAVRDVKALLAKSNDE